MTDYITSPCKHECSIIRLVRRAKQACRAIKAHNQVKQALMRATACHSGMDYSQCHADIVKEVAKLDRPGFGNHGESSEGTLFCAATLHSFGLTFDYATLEPKILRMMQGPIVGPIYVGL